MQFYAQAIFVTDGLFPGRGGVEVMGGAVELARKVTPSLQTHSSLRS